MKLLVCVKRVPMTGGRIVLTEDEQAIEVKHLGFAVSPHEECGVEEAVRLVEQHGGESVVLTLGPAEAEEQLRDGTPLTDRKGRRSYVTSAGAGPSVEKYILLAYLPPEHAVEGSSELAVEYMNERFPVTVAVAGATPLFDPENARIRS